MSKDTLIFKDGSIKEIVKGTIGPSDTFIEVSEVPPRFEVWAIGRQNFPLPCYVPLCEPGESMYSWQRNINVNTLKFIKVESEDLALALLHEAVTHGCNREKFAEMTNTKTK